MKKIDTLQFAEKAKELANHENNFFYKGKVYSFHGYVPPSINMKSKDGCIINVCVFSPHVEEFILVEHIT